ncbi:MAG: hypothetical protein LBP78_03460 [Acidaminococcales bacterium]|jgi:hypothetical protein|nr:hypothetical protein [Acidaminococcales bacterium]
MKKRGGLFFSLLLFLLVFTVAAGEKCYAKEQAYISLPAGQIRLPAGTRIVEIDVLSLLDLASDYANGAKYRMYYREDFELYFKITELFKILNDQSLRFALGAVNVYMLSVPDGGNDYTAWLVAMKSNQETEKFLPDVFKGKMTEQKKEQALAWYEQQKQETEKMFPRAKKPDFGGPVRKVAYTDLFDYNHSLEYEWQDLDFITINKKPALSHGVRATGDSNGLFSAFYVKRYMFGIGKKPALLAVVTFDSERSFWTRTFDQIMTDGFKPAAR